jgi:hypothetical protein
MCAKQWFAYWNRVQYTALRSKRFHGVLSAVSWNVRRVNVTENFPQHAILSQSGQQAVILDGSFKVIVDFFFLP